MRNFFYENIPTCDYPTDLCRLVTILGLQVVLKLYGIYGTLQEGSIYGTWHGDCDGAFCKEIIKCL